MNDTGINGGVKVSRDFIEAFCASEPAWQRDCSCYGPGYQWELVVGAKTQVAEMAWVAGDDGLLDDLATQNEEICVGPNAEGVVDAKQLISIAREFHRRGIGTTTLGVGADFNEGTLQRIAEEGGGNFYYVESAEDVAAAFLAEFGELATLIGQNLEVRISTAPGVSVGPSALPAAAHCSKR